MDTADEIINLGHQLFAAKSENKALENKLAADDREIGELRELLASAYIKISGKRRHASDCATSDAPAYTPKECDCTYEEGERQ